MMYYTEEVKEQEKGIPSITFHSVNPLIMLYEPIKRLQKQEGVARIRHTPEQMLDIGIRVTKNTRDFERALMDWQAKPPQEKTGPTSSLTSLQHRKY